MTTNEGDTQEPRTSEQMQSDAWDILDELENGESITHLEGTGVGVDDFVDMAIGGLGGSPYREYGQKPPINERMRRSLEELLQIPEQERQEDWAYLVQEFRRRLGIEE